MNAAPLPQSSPHIAIAGTGIIGLSIAATLVERGARVTLFDPAPPGRGASWAAAGMLAPAFEAAGLEGTHEALFDLCLRSARLWPGFARRIEAHTGAPVQYSPGPSLALADTPDLVAELSRMQQALTRQGIASRALTAREACRMEPSLSANLQGVLELETDGHVDNRLVVEGLLSLLVANGRVALRREAPELDLLAGRVHCEGFDAVIAAAGWRTAEIRIGTQALGLLDPRLAPITPVGGQMLSVARIPGTPDTTLRAGSLYITPKDNRVIIGASVEAGRTTSEVDPAMIDSLLARAAQICPILAEAPVLETWAGVRPATPDHAPLIGETAIEGLYVASGHFRNGILLAPVTAELMADLVLDGTQSPFGAQFSPDGRAAAAA